MLKRESTKLLQQVQAQRYNRQKATKKAQLPKRTDISFLSSSAAKDSNDFGSPIPHAACNPHSFISPDK